MARKFPRRYGKVDRHLIHATGPAKLLPADSIAAINVALGERGEFKPPIRRGDDALLPASNGDTATEDGVIDLPILP